MERFTISLDEALARQFDTLIAAKGYINRSEAVRDLIRARIDDAQLSQSQATACVAAINYVYDHHDRTVTERVLSLQHDHHDLVITSLHTHLDHDHCLETVVLRGPTPAVSAFAQTLVALRGVRHGNIHLVPLSESGKTHSHSHAPNSSHTHLKPLS
jgi:CopG family transcriptional regulator, nickel-responsive regulator